MVILPKYGWRVEASGLTEVKSCWIARNSKFKMINVGDGMKSEACGPGKKAGKVG